MIQSNQHFIATDGSWEFVKLELLDSNEGDRRTVEIEGIFYRETTTPIVAWKIVGSKALPVLLYEPFYDFGGNHWGVRQIGESDIHVEDLGKFPDVPSWVVFAHAEMLELYADEVARDAHVVDDLDDDDDDDDDGRIDVV